MDLDQNAKPKLDADLRQPDPETTNNHGCWKVGFSLSVVCEQSEGINEFYRQGIFDKPKNDK